MTRRRVAAVVSALLVFGSCGDSETSAPPRATTTSMATATESTTTTSADGAEATTPLERRDRTPLPPGVFLRFQSISQTPDPRTNHRWHLTDDGRLFLAFHSKDTSGATPFDTPLPDRPTRTLPATVVDELRRLVNSDEFRALPDVVKREGEGGMWQVVTARIDGVEREVVFDRARHPIADRLQQIATLGE